MNSTSADTFNPKTHELDQRLFPSAPSDSRGGAQALLDSARSFLEGCGSSSSPTPLGSDESGKAQILAWATQNNRVTDKPPFRLDGSRDKGGGEHHAGFDKNSGRWIKVTRGAGNSFGCTLDLRGPRWSIGRCTAAQYLTRLSLQSEVLGDDTTFHGLFADVHGNVNLITSQSDKPGVSLSNTEITDAMQASGYFPMGHSGYYSKSNNVLILDLHAENLVRSGNLIRFIDTIILKPTPAQIARLVQEKAIVA